MVLGKTRKIVLTGGPCAGKSTIAELISRAFRDQLIVVPESASLLFRGGFPRWPDVESRAALQRAIFQVQAQAEISYEQHFPDHALLLDRGTVDGAAYWPHGPQDFFAEMRTTEEAELGRYDEVIYLESAGQTDYGVHRLRNPTRTEEWDEARGLDERTRAIWAKHPSVHVVANCTAFSDKIFTVLKLVETALNK